MTRTTRRQALLALGATLAAPALACAQAPWRPSRPIRLIVPFAAGGAADSAARTITPKMAERLGQPFVVENRTGASGALGGHVVAQAQPDGHTLLWDASSHIVNPSLMRGLAFDYATAFTPISLVTSFPQVLAVAQDFPARSLQDYVAAAQARPGAISVGTQGNATAAHLALVQFTQQAGIDLLHVPFRGGAEAARALAGANVDSALITALSAGPVVDGGRARFLGVLAARRVGVRPEVPTFAEQGFPGIEISEWVALFAPAGTPEPVVRALYEALSAALADQEVRGRLAQLAAEPVGSPPEEFARFVREGRETMARLVREANIRLD
jgi:tripartite-type tricarboxylate transporter receptor subunit TctC